MAENLQSRQRNGLLASWRLGPITGLAVSSAVTLFVVTWEWLENPGGIFRGHAGTNWGFVLDTAISWFVPVLLTVVAFVSTLQLAWWLVRKGWRRLVNRSHDSGP